jgi:hypothetical protein
MDPTLDVTIFIKGQPIRTDWINIIENGTENGSPTCTIWFSMGPVGVRTYKGEDAKAARKLLAEHPAQKA